jgi:hypothetical protein
MSFPPPPQPNQPQPGQGGDYGYGPPQGFGPPPPAQGGGYGYPDQGQGGYPPPGGGGYGGYGGYGGGPGGYPPPPPPPSGGNGGKIAAIVIGAVILVAVLVGGAVVILGGNDDNTSATSGSSTSPTATESSAEPSTRDTATASSDPTDSLVPYVVLAPGKCFDHPGLNSSVSVVTTRSCSTPHDGEVIANETLTGSFTTETELQAKVLKLCEKDANARLSKMQADGKTYYYYAIYPSLATYQIQNKDTISCAITLSNTVDGKQLTKPLS